MQRFAIATWMGALLVSAGACSSSSDPAPTADVELGRQLFESKGCVACHSMDGSERIGPSLKAAFGKRVQLASGEEVSFDEAYFIESVYEPNAKLVAGYKADLQPSFEGAIAPNEIDALVAFVKSSK